MSIQLLPLSLSQKTLSNHCESFFTVLISCWQVEREILESKCVELVTGELPRIHSFENR